MLKLGIMFRGGCLKTITDGDKNMICEKCGCRIFQIIKKGVYCLKCGLYVASLGNSNYSRLKPNYTKKELIEIIEFR